MIIPVHEKDNSKECTYYRRIFLNCSPEKMYAKCLEKKSREIVESKLEDSQCGFRPGRSTTDQIFTLRQTFGKSWEYPKGILRILCRSREGI